MNIWYDITEADEIAMNLHPPANLTDDELRQWLLDNGLADQYSQVVDNVLDSIFLRKNKEK